MTVSSSADSLLTSSSEPSMFGSAAEGASSEGGAVISGISDVRTGPPPLAVREDDPWRDYAACRSSSAEKFFPIGRTGRAAEQIQAAKSICRTCEVQETCLSFALETNQDAGVWGGTSEDERRQLRRAWLSSRRDVRRITG